MPDETVDEKPEDKDTLEQMIIENAGTSKSVSVDGMSVNNRDISELIAADKYLRQKKAAESGKLPIRLFKIERGGE
ncbi:MAG: hypothetical protein FWE67_07270 [Planctomycetaceae bacterium]|nr:hypothetical protein [Planctomycetaceae bacterium]